MLTWPHVGMLNLWRRFVASRRSARAVPDRIDRLARCAVAASARGCVPRRAGPPRRRAGDAGGARGAETNEIRGRVPHGRLSQRARAAARGARGTGTGIRGELVVALRHGRLSAPSWLAE